MAQRLNIKHIPSDDVQGEGSSVKIRALTVAQYKRRLSLLQDAQKGASDASEQAMRELFAEVVVAWDWVDDEGKPLPSPSLPSTYELLTMPELMWLGQALQDASTLDAQKKMPSN